MSVPDPPPAGIAAFQVVFPLQEAKSDTISLGFVTHPHPMRVVDAWSVDVPPAMGNSFYALGGASAALGVNSPSAAEPAVPQMRMPRFDLAAMDGIQETHAEAPFSVPGLCEAWMRVPAAEPAERFLDFAYADVYPSAAPPRLPAAGDVPLSPIFIRLVGEFAPSPRPEPASSYVSTVLNSRPAAYLRAPAQLRFSLHAVEDLVARAPSTVQAPPPAGARPGPEPIPVESMPSVRAVVVEALPLTPQVLLPTVRCLTAQVLPQARAVAGQHAEAVEVMPSAGRIRIAALPMRSPLRGPTFAHFQPATDPSEPLAAPVAAPPPAAVESMPAFASFEAKPQALAPRLLVRAFHPVLRAAFPTPRVPLPEPHAVEPPAAVASAPGLEPLARINAQPAGAQPERPKPAVPRPGVIPLEYYSQRIASAPAKRVEALEPKVALRHLPWAVRPALNRIGEQPKKRFALQLEQIFATPNDGSSRVNISLTGKIAATLMVGLALWTGSRVANLSQHTEHLRAEVAASERTVTVAETRDPNAAFGKGPVGKLRRAIARRAATETTDNFRSGMSAWGAEPNSVAPGWKRHPEGYVSVGELALFQPSLKYADYRMEFYGQIEEKSMSWVVRAQDKKNFYAMKFKVIEPGLRPIIAMVHYGVVNGKPGRKRETPLNVMIHNNQPYHVAVDVHGNHFTASIEGEMVEQWTEDTMPKGGVGFFADAGEKARLYWMRLSSNQDWLGRVCAYLSGDGRSRQQTAELWTPEFPHRKPEPVHPRGADLAAAGAALDNPNSPGRVKTAKDRRREGWIS